MTPGPDYDRSQLIHIRKCIDRIRTYTSEGREAFFNSHLVQDAVVRNLQTLAESTQRLSDAFKSGEPGAPWKAMAGFRNAPVHDCLELDHQLIWRVVESDLPELESVVERMLQALDSVEQPLSGPPEPES